MTDAQRIKDLEGALLEQANNYTKLWAVVETACGVKAGFFPNGAAVIEHVSRLRKVEPPRGQIMVPGWRAQEKNS